MSGPFRVRYLISRVTCFCNLVRSGHYHFEFGNLSSILSNCFGRSATYSLYIAKTLAYCDNSITTKNFNLWDTGVGTLYVI